MQKKVALLVGVSNYHQQGISVLPSATKDAMAIKQVLQRQDMGGFAETDIKLLPNPTKKKMEDAIDDLFAECKANDLLLFYFSGHGFKDERGNLFIATPTTETKANKTVRSHTAISASFFHERMTASLCKKQIVILDCCFSGAFTKGLGLSNKSWAVLSSSDDIEYSYAPKASELSIYTRYLVEGINTGAGDLNNDGKISIDELHRYTKNKVKEDSPNMNPLLKDANGGCNIVLAKSKQDDPKLIYRKTVERFAREEEQKLTSSNCIFDGNITDHFKRYSLEEFQKKLTLTPDEAKAIEDEVLKPYHERKQKFNDYENFFVKALKECDPVSKENRKTLKEFQRVLNLRDKDVEQIEKRILDSLVTPPITKVKPPINPIYIKLRDLLAAKKWKEADKETANVMLEAYNRESSGYLSAEDNIKKLPTEVLQTINQLWVKHSGGHFGFSIQKKIYLEVSKDYDKLSDRLGWKKEGKWLHWRELNFSEQAPKGHLPSGICPLGTVEGFIWDASYVTQVLLNRNDL
ncbi:GUN4 domain-containing protein [Microcoleus sp. herbarium14]|uniref:caspase, EACC1-associated type n=1 Tax=Microcoleus sp. herbarium14 TaxID=3055439 RepID=UPI002FD366B9